MKLDIFTNLGEKLKSLLPEKNNYHFKNAVSMTVDTANTRFVICSMENGDGSTFQTVRKEYKSKLYSQSFYEELTTAVRDYVGAHPVDPKETCVTLVLPNFTVAMDTVNLPGMNRRRTADAMDAVLSSQYKNRDELKINYHQAFQNKQITAFSVAAIREENLEEDAGEDEKLDAMFGNDEEATDDPTANLEATATTIKSLPKKQPRKLPKFMLRPQPRTDEEYSYENFRIFIKWALNLIQSNERLAMLGAPESVIVNMPEDLEFLFERTNAEVEENKIEFQPPENSGGKEEIRENLEKYGGLFAYQYGKTCLF